MVEKHEIHKEIDKRVSVIDSKLKNAFSLIKKDIHEIKKHHAKPMPQSKMSNFYEAKVKQAALQNTLDKAQLEATYAKKISTLEDRQEELKHTIFQLSKQLQKLSVQAKFAKGAKIVEPTKRKSATAQILIVMAVVGVLGYLLFSHFSSFTGVIGTGSTSATIGGITGALFFILIILGLLFYAKRRKSE